MAQILKFPAQASKLGYKRVRKRTKAAESPDQLHLFPQTTAQMILGLVEFGRTIQDAIAAPRFRWKDDVGDPLPPAVILLEGRYPNAVRKALASRGYRLEILEDWSMVVGGGQGVLFREDGWMQGGGDPRRNSYALGW